MVIGLLRIIAIVCVAAACGKMLSKVKLPSILGWLIAGIVFGPYLAGVVTLDITNALWYKAAIKLFECFAGVMIGREINLRKSQAPANKSSALPLYSLSEHFWLSPLLFWLCF